MVPEARRIALTLQGTEITLETGRIVTAGGRVLNVCASGAHLRDALRGAYTAATRISWPAKILRHDIGKRVLEGDVTSSD